MNELVILFMLLALITIVMSIVQFFIELKQKRYKSHKEFLKTHSEYRLNWRGDVIRRR